MKLWLHVILVAAMACGMAACGNKGRLKSPTQIEAAEAKKARQQEQEAAKKAKRKAKAAEESPVESPVESPAQELQ